MISLTNYLNNPQSISGTESELLGLLVEVSNNDGKMLLWTLSLTHHHFRHPRPRIGC